MVSLFVNHALCIAIFGYLNT